MSKTHLRKRPRSLAPTQTHSKKARTSRLTLGELKTPDHAVKKSKARVAAPGLLTDSVPSEHICSLTNTCSNQVRLTYVLPKDVAPDIIEDLEYAWGLDRGTTEVDDPKNLLPLTPELRESFNSGQWALLPVDENIIRRLAELLYHGQSGGSKTVFDLYKSEGQTEFTYEFLPLPGFDLIITPSQDSRNPPVAHSQPYVNFPKLSLPIYPHLAIFNLMSKLTALPLKTQRVVRRWVADNKIDMVYPLETCLGMYPCWVPTRQFSGDYSHLPPVDRELNYLVCPDDSFSCASSNHAFSDSSDDKPAGDIPLIRIINTVNKWNVRVTKALTQVAPEFLPSDLVELPPPSPIHDAEGSALPPTK